MVHNTGSRVEMGGALRDPRNLQGLSGGHGDTCSGLLWDYFETYQFRP